MVGFFIDFGSDFLDFVLYLDGCLFGVLGII